MSHNVPLHCAHSRNLDGKMPPVEAQAPHRPQLQGLASPPEASMLLLVYYVIAITVLVLHFTGWLRYHNLEWLVLVLAVTVFPAVLYL
jgi:hypothetical protein